MSDQFTLDSGMSICDTYSRMDVLSTRVAAKRLKLHPATLARYVAVGKVPSPKMVVTGATTTHLWTEEEIEHVRQLLPKIANGRKTRYKKQSAKARPRKPKKK